MLGYTSGQLLPSAAFLFPFFSFVGMNAAVAVLYSSTAMHSASVAMTEAISLTVPQEGDSDGQTADGKITSIGDADIDGDDALSADQTMQLELRQLFMAHAVSQQNGGSGMCAF